MCFWVAGETGAVPALASVVHLPGPDQGWVIYPTPPGAHVLSSLDITATIVQEGCCAPWGQHWNPWKGWVCPSSYGTDLMVKPSSYGQHPYGKEKGCPVLKDHMLAALPSEQNYTPPFSPRSFLMLSSTKGDTMVCRILHWWLGWSLVCGPGAVGWALQDPWSDPKDLGRMHGAGAAPLSAGPGEVLAGILQALLLLSLTALKGKSDV